MRKKIHEHFDNPHGITSEEEEKQPWYSGPVKLIIGLFLIFILILWIVPHYGIKQNPEPERVVALSELDFSGITIPNVSSDDLRSFIQITPEIKQVADRIVVLSCERTHRICNAKAIFYFVQKNFNYLNDPLAFEYYKTPQESLRSNSGDCDDASILLSSLLRAIGFQTRFVFVPSHVYVQVKIPEAISSYKDEGDWINLDSTCRDCKFGEISYKYAAAHKEFLE